MPQTGAAGRRTGRARAAGRGTRGSAFPAPDRTSRTRRAAMAPWSRARAGTGNTRAPCARARAGGSHPRSASGCSRPCRPGAAGDGPGGWRRRLRARGPPGCRAPEAARRGRCPKAGGGAASRSRPRQAAARRAPPRRPRARPPEVQRRPRARPRARSASPGPPSAPRGSAAPWPGARTPSPCSSARRAAG